MMKPIIAASLVTLGAAAGMIATLTFLVEQGRRRKRRKDRDDDDPNRDRRSRLPTLVILVRHGESEGNADKTLWRTKPDNLINLTKKGLDQAREAGKRVESIFQSYDSLVNTADDGASALSSSSDRIKRVHMIVSPYERTLQTARAMRPALEHRVVRTDVQPRIREQEFGNLKGDDFKKLRQEQSKVGRFWFRFPAGESGADVYSRVKTWWFEQVLHVNERFGYEQVDAIVVVTHGLTMRFVLMQLFNWSPTTFHSVWNAKNCDLYVLKRDLQKPGMSPYVLDDLSGDVPRSSIDLMVEFHSTGRRSVYKLQDYLSIPPPRTTHLELVKEKLVSQYPSEIDRDDIASIAFMPFIDGAIVQGRTTANPPGKDFEEDGGLPIASTNTHPRPEMSCRFPNFSWPLQIE